MSEIEQPKVLSPLIPKTSQPASGITAYVWQRSWTMSLGWGKAPSSITCRPNLPLPVKLPPSPESNIYPYSSELSLLS